MGNESSSSDRTNQTTDPLTKRDVELILEQQRRMYELKYKELVAKTKANSPQHVQTRREELSVQEEAPARPQFIPGGVYPLKSLTDPTRAVPPVYPAPVYCPQLQPSTSSAVTYPNVPYHPLSYPTLHAQSSTSTTSSIPTSTAASHSKSTREHSFVFVYKNQAPNNSPASKSQFPPSAPVQLSPPSAVQTNSAARPMFRTESCVVPAVAPSAPPLPSTNQTRARSKSRSRPTTRNEEDGELNCPTCNNKFGTHIYQCSNGHSSCKDCKFKNVLCGICRKTITDMRNITLEAYVAEIKTPCVNAGNGCITILKVCDMEFHLKECLFKEMTCPVADIKHCNWRGKLSQITAHIRGCHPHNCQGEVDNEMLLLITDKAEDEMQLHFIELGNFYFLVHLNFSKRNKMMYMTVQLIGSEVSAKKWNYELHVYNKRFPRKKYQYNDICHSSYTPVIDIYKQSLCAAIPLQYASNYINEGGITYKFFIKKQWESNNKRYRNPRSNSKQNQ